MSEEKTTTTVLREPFKADQVGKLPRVTCGDCSDRKKTCTEHERRWCDVCKSKVSERHIHIDYVGHGDVTMRLLDADPEWDWEPRDRDIDPKVLAEAVATGNPEVVRLVLRNAPPKFDLDNNGDPVGLWINLTVGGITRPGYGSVPSGQNDAVKVLIGDALRNAAMRFGVALDLWAKGDRADPAAENATASGGRAQRRRPQRPAEEAQPAEHSADVDDGDWGDWRDVIKNIASQEDADKADADLRDVFKNGAMGPTKAKNIREAIKAKAAEVAAGAPQEAEFDMLAQRYAGEAKACHDSGALRKVHQEAMKAGKLPAFITLDDFKGTLLTYITARKAELETTSNGNGKAKART